MITLHSNDNTMKNILKTTILAAMAAMALASCEKYGVSDRKGDTSIHRYQDGQQVETFQIALIDDPDNEFVPYEDSGCLLIFLGDNEQTRKELGWIHDNEKHGEANKLGEKELLDNIQDVWGVKIYWTMPGKTAKEIQDLLLPYVPDAKIFLDNASKSKKWLYTRFFTLENCVPSNVLLTKHGKIFDTSGNHLILDGIYFPDDSRYENTWNKWQLANR